MKKILVLCLVTLLFGLISCGIDSSSTTTTSNVVTTTTDVFVHPFPQWAFMKKVDVDPAVLQAIRTSSGRIAYLDDDLYLAYAEGVNPSKFFVTYQGQTKAYDIKQSTAALFLLQYDVQNDVLYFVDDNRIESIPKTLDPTIDWHAHRSSEIKHIDSQSVVIRNTIMTIRGDTMFTTNARLVYPYQRIGEDVRFYTYVPSSLGTGGCSILSYQGYDQEPISHLVHETDECSMDFELYNRTVIIRLFKGSKLSGYATITEDGTIRTFSFVAELKDFQSYSDRSFRIINEFLVYFEYLDVAQTLHYVAASTDMSSVLVDVVNYSMAANIRYLGNQCYFRKYSNNEYRLYNGNVKLLTYQPYDTNMGYTTFDRFGDFGLILDVGVGISGGRITRIDLSTGDQIEHSFDSFHTYGKIGKHYAFFGNGTIRLYDMENDLIFDTSIPGYMLSGTESTIISYTDSKVYIYDVASKQVVITNRIGHLRRTLQPYAFLVEYQGNYYLIG